MNLTGLCFTIPTFLLTVFYLPALLIFYWLTHVRRQVSANRQVIRTKELSFFFLRNLDEQWRLGSHLAMSILPMAVLLVGYLLSAISLVSLFGANAGDSALLARFSLDAVAKYMRPIFFGFLGAYMFMLQTTRRRYLDDDLGIDTHIVIAVRVIMALIVSFIAGFVLPAEYQDIIGTALVYGAAFIFGVMPERGFETSYRIVSGWLGERFKRGHDHVEDLQECLNFDRVRLARLNVEDIKTVNDMAHVEIERLAQKTSFDLQSIFYWVDRAILYSLLKDSPALTVLEGQGIHTFTAFETAYRDTEKRQNIQAKINAEQDSDTDDLDLDVLYSAMSYLPNAQLVRLFTNYKAMQVTGSFTSANRAEAFEKMEQYDAAVADYKEALQRNRFDPTLLTRLGRARTLYARQQMRQGRFGEGRRAFEGTLHDFQNALNILPSFWQARLQRAITLLAQVPYLFDRQSIESNLDRAIEDLEQARSHNSGELEIVNWLGRAYLARKRYKDVIALAPQMRNLYSDQVPSYVKATTELIVAQALIAQAAAVSEKQRDKMLKQAHAHVTEAQGLVPRSSLLFLVQALYYHVDSPGSKQEERFLELALQPGEVQIVAQDVDYASTLLHIGADNADEIYERWGRLIRDRGEIRTAVACFSQAIAQNPARASSYQQRGALYMQLGDVDAAIADYCFLIQELECETSDVYLARARAASLASIQRLAFRTQAKNDIERAIALAPDRPDPLIAWGDWLRLSGEHTEALQAYGLAQKLLPRSNRTTLQIDMNIGIALAHCGLSEHGEAMRILAQTDQDSADNVSPTRLWLAWGVFYGLDTADPEAQMRVLDQANLLAQKEGWAMLRAADLVQWSDTLDAFLSGEHTLDKTSQIRMDVVRARLASLLGDPGVMTQVETICENIAALSNEAHKADLEATLRQVDELERFL